MNYSMHLKLYLHVTGTLPWYLFNSIFIQAVVSILLKKSYSTAMVHVRNTVVLNGSNTMVHIHNITVSNDFIYYSTGYMSKKYHGIELNTMVLPW